jgi:PPOX class probable F420-dependent enzyme
MPMTFDDPRTQQYLASKDIVVLATINSDGTPLMTPMWFLHDPSALVLISVDGLRKVRNLRRDPRLHIVAESGTRGDDIKGVAVRGRAEFLGDSPERRALATRLLDKYHPHLEKYWSGRAMPANRVMFRVTPEHVHTWGLG